MKRNKTPPVKIHELCESGLKNGPASPAMTARSYHFISLAFYRFCCFAFYSACTGRSKWRANESQGEKGSAQIVPSSRARLFNAFLRARVHGKQQPLSGVFAPVRAPVALFFSETGAEKLPETRASYGARLPVCTWHRKTRNSSRDKWRRDRYVHAWQPSACSGLYSSIGRETMRSKAIWLKRNDANNAK